MRRLSLLLIVSVVVLSACASPATPTQIPTATEIPPPTETPLPTATPTDVPTPTPTLKPSTGKILLIFGQRFIPSIYTTSVPIFEEAGFDIVVASAKRVDLKAKTGDLVVDVDILLTSVVVTDYDAILFLCDNDLSNATAKRDTNRIAQEAAEAGIVLGGICSGPRMLAWADVVEGKTVTGEPSQTCKLLGQKGADCTGKAIEQDGLMVTALNRSASKSFANTILEAIATYVAP